MIRVVIDTNVLISALLHPEGPPSKVILLAIGRTVARLCVSGEVYSEYEEVIRSASFQAKRERNQEYAPSHPGNRDLGQTRH